MIVSEVYCSEELYDLLIDKGYKGTNVHYDADGGERYGITHQCAMKWLREVLKVAIIIEPTWAFGDMREPCRWKYTIESLQTSVEYLVYTGEDSYEAACENAIKWCLENLV